MLTCHEGLAAPHCPVCNDLYVIAEPNFAVLKWVKRASITSYFSRVSC